MSGDPIQYSEKYSDDKYEYRFPMPLTQVPRRMRCIGEVGCSRKGRRLLTGAKPVRHVILPAEIATRVPKSHLMTETEWRNLGVQQSPGWVHYMMHGPEPHVLLFRRPKTEAVPVRQARGVPVQLESERARGN